MYHAARTTTCRLCEYQCYVAGNNALHSIAVDSAWWLNAACQATIVNNSRSGAQGISTNVALPAGGCCYETMLLPRTSKQGKEKTLKIVAFGPSALRQQFSMSSLSPVLRYVIIIHCPGAGYIIFTPRKERLRMGYTVGLYFPRLAGVSWNPLALVVQDLAVFVASHLGVKQAQYG